MIPSWGTTISKRGNVLAFVLVAVGSFSSTASASTAASSSGNGVTRTDAAGTVWLCRPGLSDDPCAGNLSTTVVTASNNRTVKHAVATGNSKFDCFYLYPTASPEQTVNSDLTVQPAEISNAMAQTAPFSGVCDVWAPMYRQITVHALLGGGGGSPDASTIAYDGVRSSLEGFLGPLRQGSTNHPHQSLPGLGQS